MEVLNQQLDWSHGLPEKELYDVYHHTVGSRFPAFGVRAFESARFDMAQPFHAYDNSQPIDQNLVDIIVTPDSHQQFSERLDEYANKYGLGSWLEHEGSLVFATDHGQFTDVPVTAHTLNTVNLGIPEKNVQVVSKMISALSLNIGEGDFDVIRKLQHISNVVQTVPRLDGNPSEKLEAYRARSNEDGLTIISDIKKALGSITVLSVIGRHNQTSKNKNTLYIHEPNRQTLAQFMARDVKVIPLYLHCPTFQEDGAVTPANLQFELFAPMNITDPEKDTKRITEMFRDATQKTVGHLYKNGVKKRSFNQQQARHTATKFGRRFTHDSTIDTDY